MTDSLFPLSPRAAELAERLDAFMERHVYPNEAALERQIDSGDRWAIPPLLEQLKAEARAAGLWNLFLTDSERGPGLTNLEYAPLAERMGRSHWAPELCNCSAPDTGNMEVLDRFGTPAQQERWLTPLLAGEIRSCFAMTEPAVASSDPTNLATVIERSGDGYRVDGHKWWISGASDPRCRVALVVGLSDPDAERHRRHSIILVPMDAPGVEVVRPLTVFGYDHAPHGHSEVIFRDVEVPAENLILGEGRGFEVAQGRLGPGRVHHSMRLIGLAERALEMTCRRALSRVAFGEPIAAKGTVRAEIAESRMAIEQARLLTLAAAHKMDRVGAPAARREIAMLKVVAPRMALAVIDRAIQVHGGGGMSGDFPLAAGFVTARALRLADGPDEVHAEQLARWELKRWRRKIEEEQAAGAADG